MTTYLVKRLLLMIPTLFGVSFVVWLVLTSAPEPPIDSQVPSEDEGEEQKGGMSAATKVFRAQYGLDKPAILNFYYSIDTGEVEGAVRVAQGIGGEYDAKARNAARERLIRWGYYSVPNLLAVIERSDGEMRDAALGWFLQSASRVTLIPQGGRVDAATASLNEEITREKRILERISWKRSDPAERKAAGVAALRVWFDGVRGQFEEGLPREEVESRLDTGAQEWAQNAVPGLVAIVLGDAGRRDQAIAALPGAARRFGGSAADEIHNRILKLLTWQDDASDSKRAGRLELVRYWWNGAAARWDYSGLRKLQVMFGETRFARYWGNLLRLDLGESTVHRRPVIELILMRLKYSLSLAVPSLLLAFLISVPLGLLSATMHGTWTEKGMSLIVFALYSLPSFFVATVMIRYMATGQPGSLEWIPPGEFERADAWELSTWVRIKHIMWHLAAPLFCMTYASLAALSRYSKTGLLNVIRSDYVRTARAKGVSEFWVIVKHATRNGIIPIITLLGTTLPVVIGGNFIIETVFSIPGFGYLMVTSVFSNDYNVIIGITLVTAVLTMLGILLSDILYAVADPRISYS